MLEVMTHEEAKEFADSLNMPNSELAEEIKTSAQSLSYGLTGNKGPQRNVLLKVTAYKYQLEVKQLRKEVKQLQEVLSKQERTT
jgi:hypothetical protein